MGRGSRRGYREVRGEESEGSKGMAGEKRERG